MNLELCSVAIYFTLELVQVSSLWLTLADEKRSDKTTSIELYEHKFRVVGVNKLLTAKRGIFTVWLVV